ncbi:MAG: FixH family protein [Hyphomicrobium sp.]
MTTFFSKRAAAAVLAGVLSTTAPSSARADIKDYEFRLDQSDVKQGTSAVVAVRLVEKRSSKAVPDAVIIATRIDMAPDGMPTMTAPIEALPSAEAGVYRFKANLTMAGGWQLSLAAKIQGENGTLESKLVLKATP